MVTLRPNDRVVQRPDAVVQYRCRPAEGWHNPITSARVVRRRPYIGTLLPRVDVVSADAFTVQTRVGETGTPGARYDVELRGPAGRVGMVQLVVSWSIPTFPQPGQPPPPVTLLQPGTLWIADQPLSLGTGRVISETGGKA